MSRLKQRDLEHVKDTAARYVEMCDGSKDAAGMGALALLADTVLALAEHVDAQASKIAELESKLAAK
jgi:hypothetical protein